VPVPIDLEFVAVSIVPAVRFSSIRSGLRWDERRRIRATAPASAHDRVSLPHRPRFRRSDRAFLVAAARRLPRDRWERFLVDPKDAAALAPRAGPREVGSIRQATSGQAAAADRAARADPAPREREPEMGIQAHPGRALKARDQDIGHCDQKAACPPRPRAGSPAGRNHVAAVLGPAGFEHGGMRLLHR
jgi:hypothetical protein